MLRRLRRGADLTLEGLREASGVSVRAISDMERGRSRGPQPRTVSALADALGLDHETRATLDRAARVGRRRSAFDVPGVAELPPQARDFAGREGELDWLVGLAERTRLGSSVVAIISGSAGLGKTALATHAAWRLQDRFQQRRYFMDLRGLDAEPLDPQQALSRILRALGVPESRVPSTPEDRQGLYRRLLREQRSLVVLDNAAYDAQVRPLLPGDGPSMVLITSRRALSGIEFADRLVLGPLSPAESASVLSTIVGADRLDPVSALTVAELCGQFPLALRIAGNRMLSRSAWTATTLMERLADETRRLDRLTAGDLRIQSAFGLSYGQLSDRAKLVFRRLSLVPGPDVCPAHGAILTGLDIDEVDLIMDELVELGLITPTSGDRGAFHDLIRLYARQRLRDEEGPDVPGECRRELYDWFLSTAVAAGAWFVPSKRLDPADGDGAEVVDDDVPGTPHGQEAAERWLRQEAPNWLTAMRDAAGAGRHARVMEVADAMHWFSDRWIFSGHWLEVFSLARTAAALLGDVHGEAVHLNYLAWTHAVALDEAQRSRECALEARRLAHQVGDLEQQAWAFDYAARAAISLADYEQALAEADQAAAFFAGIEHVEGMTVALIEASTALALLGRHQEARDRTGQVVRLLSDVSRQPDAHFTATHLSVAHRRTGMSHAAQHAWQEAETAYRQGLAALSGIDNPGAAAPLLLRLGQALRQFPGREQEAAELLRQALELAVVWGDESLVTQVREELGP